MKNILLTLLLLSPLTFAEELSLMCEGVVDKVEATVGTATTNFNNSSTNAVTSVIGTKNRQYEASIFIVLELEEETGTLEVPETMRRPNAKLLKTDLYNVKITDKKISAKAKFNFAARHKFNIDRRTGDINYRFPDAKFNGKCKKYEQEENQF